MRETVVRKLRFPDAGVTRVDADTLAIKHARLYQGEWTREALESKLKMSVEIVEVF